MPASSSSIASPSQTLLLSCAAATHTCLRGHPRLRRAPKMLLDLNVEVSSATDPPSRRAQAVLGAPSLQPQATWAQPAVHQPVPHYVGQQPQAADVHRRVQAPGMPGGEAGLEGGLPISAETIAKARWTGCATNAVHFSPALPHRPRRLATSGWARMAATCSAPGRVLCSRTMRATWPPVRTRGVCKSVPAWCLTGSRVLQATSCATTSRSTTATCATS